MDIIIERFDVLHREVFPEYLHHCNGIAFELSQLLDRPGSSPVIIEVTPKNPRDLLLPTPYEGRYKWLMHIICTANGMVYDPIFPTPQLYEEYLANAFEQAVDTKDVTQLVRPGSSAVR